MTQKLGRSLNVFCFSDIANLNFHTSRIGNLLFDIQDTKCSSVLPYVASNLKESVVKQASAVSNAA